jgi:hypothetical protein
MEITRSEGEIKETWDEPVPVDPTQPAALATRLEDFPERELFEVTILNSIQG